MSIRMIFSSRFRNRYNNIIVFTFLLALLILLRAFYKIYVANDRLVLQRKALCKEESTMSSLGQAELDKIRARADWRTSALRERPPANELHEKWIVLTTINRPTEDVKKLADIDGWRVVVVGDTKTPPDWRWVSL